MCGITGLIAGKPWDHQELKRMTDSIRHRGPDDEGYVLFSASSARAYSGFDTPASVANRAIQHLDFAGSFGEIRNDGSHFLGLGHRRLAILDLSPLGHQPMSYLGRYWIAFNGEIYNYLELRYELQSLGYEFRSDSDTEVILAAYDAWSEKCLSRFLGMWALAIYDSTKDRLFISRDRFGIKPLYFTTRMPGFFLFASEIKALTSFPNWDGAVNGQAAYDFLAWGITDHSENTLHEGVQQLRAGHWLRLAVRQTATSLANGGSLDLKPEQWYRIQPRTYRGSYLDAQREIRDVLGDTVALHLRADVPVGCLLSGGLDSSTLYALANRERRSRENRGVRAFSAIFPGTPVDESRFIAHVLEETEGEAYSVEPRPDELWRCLSRMTYHQDEPVSTTSSFAQWAVFEAVARHGYKVVLDGQGADEEFCGYHSFLAIRIGELLMAGAPLDAIKEAAAALRLPGVSVTKLSGHILLSFFPHLSFSFGRALRAIPMRADWIDAARLKADVRDPLSESRGRGTSLQGMSLAQLERNNLPMLLRWEDRNAMAHSVESRIPYLDHRLAELAMALPSEFKVHRGVTKRILRDAASGLIPDSVRMRKDKLGFVAPDNSWLRGPLWPLFKGALDEAVERMNGTIGPGVADSLTLAGAGINKYDGALWRIAVFATWLKVFNLQLK